jgi:hypothetical protein
MLRTYIIESNGRMCSESPIDVREVTPVMAQSAYRKASGRKLAGTLALGWRSDLSLRYLSRFHCGLSR